MTVPQRIEVLDDAGRAALKPGDHVLIACTVTDNAAPAMRQTGYPAAEITILRGDVYARMRDPIEVGDTVRQVKPMLRGVTFEVVAKSDGFLWLRDLQDGAMLTGLADSVEVVS